MNLLYLFISILIAYFLGSIPSGFIFGKLLYNIDLRDYGSRNIGATNTLRVLGTIPGIIALVFDIVKGYLAVELGKNILNHPDFIGTNLEIYLVLIGMMVIAGHIFPIFLKFKGGKGVATGAGVFLNLTPIALLVAFIIFLIIVAITRYVSLGSLTAGLALFTTQFVYTLQNIRELPYLILSTIVVIFIFIRHQSNIRRLCKGQEAKIKFSKSGKNL